GTRQKIFVALTLFALSEVATWIFVREYGYWVLGKTLGLRSFCNWDCYWYGSILLHGYDRAPFRHDAGDAANWGFFPLFPLLGRVWHQLAGLGYGDALILTGTLAMPFAIYLFVQLADEEAIPVNPWLSGSLVAFNPYALYAHTGYTEPLYF